MQGRTLDACDIKNVSMSPEDSGCCGLKKLSYKYISSSQLIHFVIAWSRCWSKCFFFLRISTYFDVLRNIFILHLDLLGGPRQSLGRAPRAHRSHCLPMDLDVNKSHPVPSHVKDALFVHGFFGDQESWRDRNWRRSFRNETRKEEKTMT